MLLSCVVDVLEPTTPNLHFITYCAQRLCSEYSLNVNTASWHRSGGLAGHHGTDINTIRYITPIRPAGGQGILTHRSFPHALHYPTTGNSHSHLSRHGTRPTGSDTVGTGA